MTDRDENRRIGDAKSRISRFTFENNHLMKQIEGLKKEIASVEANKERLIAQLSDSDTISPEESDLDHKHDASESESVFSSNPVSTISLSECIDTGSSISSIASLYVTDAEQLRRHRSLETTLSSDFRRECFDKTEHCFVSAGSVDVSSNINFESISWLQKFILNLNEIKNCFSSNQSENYQLLEAKFSALQELAYKRMEILLNNSKNSSIAINKMSENDGDCSSAPQLPQGGNKLTQPAEYGDTSRRFFSCYNFFNFLSIPFLFVLGCGYIGLLMYVKQIDACFIVTPPQ